MRLFFAIEIPDAVRDTISDFQESLKASSLGPVYRWMKPEHFHVTLAFLGNAEPDEVDLIRDAAKLVCERHPETSLRFQGLQSFDVPRRPRVLHIPGAEFTGLNTINGGGHELQQACSSITNVDFSYRIIPHITLARLTKNLNKQVTAAVNEAIRTSENHEFGAMAVKQFCLYESNLTGEGSRYHLIDRFPLKG